MKTIYLRVVRVGTIVDLLALLQQFPFQEGDEIRHVTTNAGGCLDIRLRDGELSERQLAFLRERYPYTIIVEPEAEDISEKLATLNSLRARVNRASDTIGRVFAPLLEEQGPTRADLEEAEKEVSRLMPKLELRYSVGFQSYGLFPRAEGPHVGQVYAVRFKTAFSFQDEYGQASITYPAGETIHGVKVLHIERDAQIEYTQYVLQWNHALGNDAFVQLQVTVFAQIADFFLGLEVEKTYGFD